jgi:REP element-mobilizing transposase RayT
MARDIALREIVAFHGELFDLQIVVVMSDHVDVVLVPLPDRLGYPHPLAEIMQRIKGRSSRLINIALNRTGAVWQREYFDRQLRSDEDAFAKCDYVAANPIRKGIVSSSQDYPWLWRSKVASRS